MNKPPVNMQAKPNKSPKTPSGSGAQSAPTPGRIPLFNSRAKPLRIESVSTPYPFNAPSSGAPQPGKSGRP